MVKEIWKTENRTELYRKLLKTLRGPKVGFYEVLFSRHEAINIQQ